MILTQLPIVESKAGITTGHIIRIFSKEQRCDPSRAQGVFRMDMTEGTLALVKKWSGVKKVIDEGLEPCENL
jgi:hypothetical protein